VAVQWSLQPRRQNRLAKAVVLEEIVDERCSELYAVLFEVRSKRFLDSPPRRQHDWTPRPGLPEGRSLDLGLRAGSLVTCDDRTLSEVTRRRGVEDGHRRGPAGSLSIEALGRSRWRLRRTRGTGYVC
jgi:hypothetical protein